MTDIELLLAVLLFALFWPLWSFLIGAVIWVVGAALDLLDRLASE